jgi:hypothetical protein
MKVTLLGGGTFEFFKSSFPIPEELFGFRMFSSCALHRIKPLGEGILRIRGHLSSTSQGPLVLRMPSP